MSALRRAHAEPLRRPPAGAHSTRPSRIIRRIAVSDHATLRHSLERALESDFERIIPGHGDVIEDAGHDAIRAAWLTRD